MAQARQLNKLRRRQLAQLTHVLRYRREHGFKDALGEQLPLGGNGGQYCLAAHHLAAGQRDVVHLRGEPGAHALLGAPERGQLLARVLGVWLERGFFLSADFAQFLQGGGVDQTGNE